VPSGSNEETCLHAAQPFKASAPAADVQGMARLLDRIVEALRADIAEINLALREVAGEAAAL
jgi:hypothetical protein